MTKRHGEQPPHRPPATCLKEAGLAPATPTPAPCPNSCACRRAAPPLHWYCNWYCSWYCGSRHPPEKAALARAVWPLDDHAAPGQHLKAELPHQLVTVGRRQVHAAGGWAGAGWVGGAANRRVGGTAAGRRQVPAARAGGGGGGGGGGWGGMQEGWRHDDAGPRNHPLAGIPIIGTKNASPSLPPSLPRTSPGPGVNGAPPVLFPATPGLPSCPALPSRPRRAWHCRYEAGRHKRATPPPPPPRPSPLKLNCFTLQPARLRQRCQRVARRAGGQQHAAGADVAAGKAGQGGGGGGGGDVGGAG